MTRLTKLAAILAVVILAQAYGGTDQKPGVTYNADANGDGIIDITDPVMVLHWLFADGPGPAEVFAQDGGSSALEARVGALERLLHGVDRVSVPDGQGRDIDTIRISGANLQVVNGTGKTGQNPNGAGNLVVGYNSPPTDRVADRTGSHNLVVGDQNNFTSWGALITGTRNTSEARFANVLGGKDRTVEEDWGGAPDGRLGSLEALTAGWTRFDREPTPGNPVPTYLVIPGTVTADNLKADGGVDRTGLMGNLSGRLWTCGLFDFGPDSPGWDCEPFHDSQDMEFSAPVNRLWNAINSAGERITALEGAP